MRRLFVTLGLLFMAAVMMGSLCEDRYAPYTKIYVANRGDTPFHANKSERIDPGCSLPILNLQHGATGYININRNEELLCILVVESKVDVSNEEDWEAAIMLTEQTNNPGSFSMAVDREDLIKVTMKY